MKLFKRTQQACLLSLLSISLYAQNDLGQMQTLGPVEPAEPPPTKLFGSGKLLLTGGIPNIDGVGGGGITTSALIGGYGSDGQIGGYANYSTVSVNDFTLETQSVGIGFFNRVELSLSMSEFDTEQAGARLGLGEGYTFENDSVGIKVRIFGDAILDQDSWMPQVSVGFIQKESENEGVLAFIGAQDNEDTETYISATKLFLEVPVLLNVTARHSNANQNGILGFGGDRQADKEWLFEGFAAVLLNDDLALGVEYKRMPDNLSFARQDDWKDIFLLYTPNKHISLALAYADIGDVALQGKQSGYYASITANF